MGLSSQDGYRIRKEYTEIKEKLICDKYGLEQKGKGKTKIDGLLNESIGKSIKNSKSKSTQVHLTTQKSFCNFLSLNNESKTFIELFCGNASINNNGSDRYTIKEIHQSFIDSIINSFDSEKEKLITYLIKGTNTENICSIIFNDLNENKSYELTFETILQKIKNTKWVTLDGGIHLKNMNNKTYFHMQREGKKNKKNRYNVLWHIHKNIFID